LPILRSPFSPGNNNTGNCLNSLFLPHISSPTAQVLRIPPAHTMMRHRFWKPVYRQLTRVKQGAALAAASTRSPLQRRLAVSTAASTASSKTFSSEEDTVSSRLLAAAALAGAATLSALQHEKKTDCCGIVGVVGSKDHVDAREFLLDGLTILKNRGYDSAGIATVAAEGGEMSITKFASDGDKADSIELVGRHSHSLGHTLGIAHTRWYVVYWGADDNARICLIAL
jgi:hypothetical protein